ncbi:MAG: enoyl-CoA hydratase/isomerase family protein [Gammaproteobacteria bacterium]
MSETVLLSITGPIARISFNRPTAMNAFDKQMADELEAITNQIKNDTHIRAVLLNGNGPLFMAGGDIRFFHEAIDRMPEGVIKIVRTLNASIMNLMQMAKPVLASVHGSVAGVGLGLMMACDLVIAADNTKFTTAYSGLGVSPDGGISFNLPRIVGTKKAMEWLLLPDLIDAQTAATQGLINWVTPADTLIDKTTHLLERLAQGPTGSYANIKRLVNTSWDNSLAQQLEHEGKAFEESSMSDDFKLGVSAFLQKAKPAFTGK